MLRWGLAQVFATVVAFMAAGAGHGSYLPASLLLPFSTVFIAAWKGEGIAGAFFLVFGVSQFLIYGLIHRWGKSRQLGEIALWAIGVAHAVAFAATALLEPDVLR